MLMKLMNQMRTQNEAERARSETEMTECLSMIDTLTRTAMSATSMTHDQPNSNQPHEPTNATQPHSSQHYHAQAPSLSESANVPALDRRLRLNSTGDFVEGEGLSLTDTRLSNGVKRKLSGRRQSFEMEDQVQDRRKKMSFTEVTSKEKMEVTARYNYHQPHLLAYPIPQVFRLAAVRRSMRHIPYAQILMSEEVMEIQNRYMEIGPSRASLLHIGWESLQGPGNCKEQLTMDEIRYIHPVIAIIGYLRGYHWAGE